ncbi:MAG: hypothetical protein ACYDBB_22470 [Armatimonadota bacterium]
MKMRWYAALLAMFVIILGLVSAQWLLADEGKPKGFKVPARDPHTEWVAKSLKEMETVRVGMTRAELLKVLREDGGFRGEGGYKDEDGSFISSSTYVYLKCPYIKVDVTFILIGKPGSSDKEQSSPDVNPQDKIKTISRPYLESPCID